MASLTVTQHVVHAYGTKKRPTASIHKLVSGQSCVAHLKIHGQLMMHEKYTMGGQMSDTI